MSRLVDISPYEDCRIVLKPEDSGFPASELPTVDAVEVVRCCECKQHDHDGGAGYCNRWGKWSNMSDFCSYGKRKEGSE